MLTDRTIIRAAEQASGYGDGRNAALEHLDSRLAGYRSYSSADLNPSRTNQSDEENYRWNEEIGMFEFLDSQR